MSVSLGEFSAAFGMGAEPSCDRHVWGSVRSVNPDGSYQVRLNASSMDTRCACACSACEGDRVLVCIMADGRAAAVARVGGGGFIHATGSSGIWRFTKWSDGHAIAYTRATFNSGAWTQWNDRSWYAAKGWQASYPFEFATIPYESVEMTAAGLAVMGYQANSTENVSKSKTNIYTPMREGSASACKVMVRCLLFGRWK